MIVSTRIRRRFIGSTRRSIARCAKCGDEIHEGDRLFQFRSDTFCELCGEEMTLQDLADWYEEQGWNDK